ncbi:hypothetical protein ACO0R3_002670 [Hanseniaspora guilliermondii]
MNEDTIIDAVDYLENQEKLDYEAYQALPYKFDTCTFNVSEAKRQMIFSCMDCKVGICYSCSISCEHYNHEIIEVGYKKNFSCECGSLRNDQHTCNLFDKKHINYDLDNVKGQNFTGEFCFCKDKIPADDDKMIQCTLGHSCNENWFHLSCLNLEKHGIIEDDFEEFICSDCMDLYCDIFEKIFEKYSEMAKLLLLKVVTSQSEYESKPALLLKKTYSKFFQYILNAEMQEQSSDLKTFLGKIAYHDLVNPYEFYEPPREEFQSRIKVDSSNYIADEDVYSKNETEIMRLAVEEKQLDVERFNAFKDGLKSFLTGFARNKDVIKKEDIDMFFKRLKSQNIESVVEENLSLFSNPESEQEELESD